MHMGAWNMQRRTLLAALALPAPALANTPPLKLLGTGAVAASARDIAARFTAATGREVRLEIANAGVVARRLREGEAADLVLNSATQIAALTDAGLLRPGSQRELGRMLIGVAGKAGAALPDISTEAALRAAILAAPAIAHSDPSTGATAGTHAARLIERLGLAEALRGAPVPLKITNHHRKRMRSDNAADDVVRIANRRHPVSHGIIDGIPQSP
jgi:molybdate transport system substrate-binding protein